MSARQYRQRQAPALPASIDGARKNLLAKIHIQQKDLALTEDSYRDILERITGHRTAAVCSDQQLYGVLKEFDRLGAGGNKRQHGRPIANSPMARRCRALWLSLWNLDELDSGTEKALATFVKRQTGREDMRFCNAEQFASVIDALKDWCRRCGVVDINTGGKLGILPPKRALVREQWGRLRRAGWPGADGDSGLVDYALARQVLNGPTSIEELRPIELDDLAKKLGVLVRQQQLGRRHGEVAA